MKLSTATPEQFKTIKEIISSTIKNVYQNYYPQGVVELFLAHHSDKNIQEAIDKQAIYLIHKDGDPVGTGSIKNNEISRLFILPQYQHHGYGTYMMDFLGKLLFQSFEEVTLDSSIPAYNMYIKRGYVSISFERILTGQAHYLCYHVMKCNRKNAWCIQVLPIIILDRPVIDTLNAGRNIEDCRGLNHAWYTSGLMEDLSDIIV